MNLVDEQVDEAGRLAMADLEGQTVADEAQIVLPLQGYGSLRVLEGSRTISAMTLGRTPPSTTRRSTMATTSLDVVLVWRASSKSARVLMRRPFTARRRSVARRP